MKLRFEGAYAVDAGALIDLVYNTEEGEALRESVIKDTASLLTHDVAIVELRYILCRRLGKEEAWARVDKLLTSGYLIIENLSNLTEDAALLKCRRHISLPDCFTLVLAMKYQITALFASKESEIVREMESSPFNTDIQFLSKK